MQAWWCPIAYRSRPTADGRRIAADADVAIRDNAPVLLQPPRFPHMTVAVGIIREPLLEWMDDEIWAKVEFLSNADIPAGYWYPEIGLDVGSQPEWADEYLWFDQVHIVSITLGRNPAWTGIRPSVFITDASVKTMPL